MNRRRALGVLGATLTAGSAGCLQSILPADPHRLQFIRIHNASTESEGTVRVHRGDNLTFEDQFSLPEFVPMNEQEDPEPVFYERPHNKLLEGEWNTDPANFDIEYTLQSHDDWSTENLRDVEKEIVGVTIQILGFNTGKSVNTRTHEFDNTDQVQRLLHG